MNRNEIAKTALCMIVVYILQFIVIPKCFPVYYPISNEACIVLIIPLILISVLINVNTITWLIADIAYGLMVNIYNGNGLYGIGSRGISLDGMKPIQSHELTFITSLIIVLALIIFQILIRVCRSFKK